MCPIASWGNPDAARLDAHASYKTFNLYLRRVYDFRHHGEILDPLTLEPIPIHPVPPRFSSPAAREDVDEEVDPLEIVLPQAFPNASLLFLSFYFCKKYAFFFSSNHAWVSAFRLSLAQDFISCK